MKSIPLSGKHGKGKFTIVDDSDYDHLIQFNWYVTIVKKQNTMKYYVAMKLNGKYTLMHRYIYKINNSKIHIDHINHNTLDNRKENLRICSNQENSRNRIPRIGTSKYKGVQQDRFSKNWIATIKIDNKSINLGSYKEEIDAALAYDMAARQYFKDFAYVNFPNIYTYNNLSKIEKKRSSSFPGVTWHKTQKKWLAFYKEKNYRKHIGTYDTEEDAHNSRLEFIRNRKNNELHV